MPHLNLNISVGTRELWRYPWSLGSLFSNLVQLAVYSLSCPWNYQPHSQLRGYECDLFGKKILFPVNSIFLIALDLNPFIF